MHKLTLKQAIELNEIIEVKIQELFDSITYTLEDLVAGKQYDENGNVTDEFLELRNLAVSLILHEIKIKSINS